MSNFVSLVFVDKSVIRAVSSVLYPSNIIIESNKASTERTKNVIRCMQTLDIDEAKQFIFDHRKLNGNRKKFDVYFKYANMYVKNIEELISVNAGRHSTSM